MKGDNEIRLHGRVKRKPFYGVGAKSSYCFLTIETGNEKYKQYHNVTLFKDLADWAQNLKEGHEVWVRGEMQYKSYKLPDPENAQKTLYISDAKVVAHDINTEPLKDAPEEVDDRP